MSLPRIAGMVGYPGAGQYPGKNTGPRVYQGHQCSIRYIVVHGVGWPQSFDRYLIDSASQCAITYMVAKDGRIAQFESDLNNHWGNGVVSRGAAPWWGGDSNQISISIEHEKWQKDNSDIITPAQKLASFSLIAWLCRMYSIPMRVEDASGGIAPHSSVNPVYRAFCPGPYPWSELFTYINAPQSYIPAGWQDLAAA